jgi:outer membrane protein
MTAYRAAFRPLGALALSICAANGSIAQQAPAGVTTIGSAARAAAERAAPVLIARERAAQADARVRQARGALLPTISGTASDGERTLNSASFGFSLPNPATGQPLLDPNGQVLGPVKTWDFRASVRTSLADPSAIAKLGVVRAGADASDAEMQLAAQQAAANAAVACIAAMRADALRAGRLADTVLASELMGIARAQLSAGTGIALDVTRAETQLAIARSQLVSASAAQQRTRVDLSRAMGGTPTALFNVEDLLADRGEVAAINPGNALATALANRAELKAAAAQLSAAERQVRAVRAERLPSVAAFADDGATGKSTNHLLNTWSWGVQASIPVFDGFRREGRIAEQRAASREFEARQKDLRDQVDAEIQIAYVELAAARTQVEAALERQRLATQEVAQARDRFSSGVSGNADVIVASQNLNAARTFLVDARASLLLAQVMWARAQGIVTQLP